MKKIVATVFTHLSKMLSGKGLFKYRFVRFAYHKIKHSVKPDFVVIFGNKIFLDPKDSMNLSVIGERYEKNTTEYLLDKVKKGDIIIDVGANIGFYTLFFSKLVGERGRVYSFEPELENFQLLKKNVEINNCKNVKLINKAVSNKTDKLFLNITPKASGMHYLSTKQMEKTSIQVNVTSLDDFFKDYEGGMDFIKIDVEGAELDVIKGMNKILTANPSATLIVEFNLETLERSNVSPKDFLLCLENKGYKLFDLENKSFISSQTLDQKLNQLTNGTNLVCNKTN